MQIRKTGSRFPVCDSASGDVHPVAQLRLGDAPGLPQLSYGVSKVIHIHPQYPLIISDDYLHVFLSYQFRLFRSRF